MVRLARAQNRGAIAAGRLEIVEAEACRLPFPDAAFSCAVMTGVLALLPDPVAVLAEIRRALASGGRVTVFAGAPELRGTPAAPEPVAGHGRFYEDSQLERLAAAAGLVGGARGAARPRGARRAAGVPQEHVALFAGRSGQLLSGRAP